LIAVCAGCGGGQQASVSGVVTIDGTPVARGTVTYYPTAPGSAAYGTISEDGSYEVRTGREAGLPPGEYLVTVAANEAAPRNAEAGPPPPGKLLVPRHYRFKDQSGLKFTVAEGHNEIDLELSSAAPKVTN
jgi:hypothetical protein